MYSVDLVKCNYKAQLREEFNEIEEARNPISATHVHNPVTIHSN